MTIARGTRREWWWVILFAGAVMLLTSIPYGLAWTRPNADQHFEGFLYGIEDGHSYLGKMRLGARGELEFFLFYTPEAHDSEALVFLPYVLPGWIVGRFIDSTDPALTPALMGTFHLMRIVFGVGLIVMIYRFAAAFLEKARERWLATILAVFGGGIGWGLMLSGNGGLLGSAPAEFYIPEGFSWLILLGIPHLALARMALLGGLLALMTAATRDGWLRWSALAAGCWMIMALAVPFYLPIIYCIVGAWGLAMIVRDRRFPVTLFVRAVTACALTLPLFGYYTLIFARNPAFAIWSSQNLLASPHPLHYGFAYGILAALAFFAARQVWHRVEGRYRLLVGWLVIVPFLVYLPMTIIPVQRRMSEAVIVPLAILAALTLSKLATVIRVPIVIVVIASSALLWMGAFFNAANPSSALYRPMSEVAVLNWISAHAEPGAILLSSVPMGNVAPAYTDVRTFMGHGPETLFWRDKTRQLEAFYRDELSTADKIALLRDPCAPEFACAGGVRYVLFGADEAALTHTEGTPPTWFDALPLRAVYHEGDQWVFEVDG